MPCSHCNQSGHTYLKCPTMSEEDKKKKKEDNIKKKKEQEERRNIRRERELELQRQRELKEKNKKKYIIHNDNDYEIALYWSFNDSPFLNHFTYIASRTRKYIKTNPFDDHRLVIFNTLDVLIPGSTNAEKLINFNNERFKDITKLIDIKLKDFENNYNHEIKLMIENQRNENSSLMNYYNNTNNFYQIDYYNHNYPEFEVPQRIIYINHKMEKVKTELEKWKECGLKSHFLLNEIIKMGGKQYDNLEPLLDLVEDINLPNHTEYDKELAGIPSQLTNIT